MGWFSDIVKAIGAPGLLRSARATPAPATPASAVQPTASGSTWPTGARSSAPAAARALEQISTQWVDNAAISQETRPPNAFGQHLRGAPRSVDPLGVPFKDPAPPRYGFPQRPVTDHIKNRARGGDANAADNLDTKTWEANSRKAGFEGNYTKDLQRLVAAGMTVTDAEKVLEFEDHCIQNDVHARPVDPALLDTLPSQPQEEESEDEDEFEED